MGGGFQAVRTVCCIEQRFMNWFFGTVNGELLKTTFLLRWCIAVHEVVFVLEFVM